MSIANIPTGIVKQLCQILSVWHHISDRDVTQFLYGIKKLHEMLPQNDIHCITINWRRYFHIMHIVTYLLT